MTSGHRDEISFHPSQTEAHLESFSFSDNESKVINLEEVTLLPSVFGCCFVCVYACVICGTHM